MPTTKIWWMTKGEIKHAAQLLTSNVCRHEKSDYQVQLTNKSKTVIASDVFTDYPQFSESALGLVARAIRFLGVSVYDVLYWHPVECRYNAESKVDLLDISVSVVPIGPGGAREIEGLHVDIYGDHATCQYRNETYVGDTFEFSLGDDDRDVLQLTIHAICRTLWGTSSLPPLPKPLQVPIYTWGKTRYILLTDIPELARGEFARHLGHTQRPNIPTKRKEDCAFAKDWEDFLCGETQFEVGFVPGLRLPVQYG